MAFNQGLVCGTICTTSICGSAVGLPSLFFFGDFSILFPDCAQHRSTCVGRNICTSIDRNLSQTAPLLYKDGCQGMSDRQTSLPVPPPPPREAAERWKEKTRKKAPPPIHFVVEGESTASNDDRQAWLRHSTCSSVRLSACAGGALRTNGLRNARKFRQKRT